MKNIIKTLVFVMTLALVLVAFTGCDLKQQLNDTICEINGHTIVIYGEVDATCTEDGHSAGAICSVCGYVERTCFVFPATGHDKQVVDAKAPTCTEAGNTSGEVCATCHEVLKATMEIAPLGHVWDNPEAEVKTCRNCGEHINPNFAGGKGTAADPYLIANVEQLQFISELYGTYYYYYKVTAETLDLTGVGKIYLHGSFDGNGVKISNLSTALFQYVGYQNSVEDIKISNLDVTFSSTDGCALVRNLFNAGVTTFENVSLHGYIEGLYNMGSFYNYGTANYDGNGADYTVRFVNATSDVTLVCTSGNGIGGLIGHGYEGTGNVITINVDDKSGYTGTMYTTNGSACDKLMYMGSNGSKFVLNGVDVSGYDASFNYPSTKIASVLPTLGENGYVVAPVEGATTLVVYLNAQVTAYDEEGYKIANKAGLTWPLSNTTITELGESVKVFDAITSATIVNGTDHDFGYTLEDGVLTIYSGRSASYESANVTVQVNQYDAEGNLLATGTVKAYTLEHDHTFVGLSCTTGGKCNCGTEAKATGHNYVEDIIDATCTADGCATYECSVCFDSYDVAIPAKGHADENGDYKCDTCAAYLLPEVGTAFKLHLVQATLGKTLYFTGNMNGYYYETSEAIGAGVDVYLESVDGGYHMYFLKGDTKNYLYIEKSGTYNNVKIGTTSSSVWTWNEEFGMFVTDLEGVELYIGTYNSFNTISASQTTRVDASTVNVSQFIARPYVIPAHDCDFTEATCTVKATCTICGATTGELKPHDYSVAATCTINAMCTCGAEKADSALGHDTENGTCGRCGNVIGGSTPVIGTLAKFELGTATSDSSNAISTYTETVNGYKLNISGTKMYNGFGNSESGLKFGSSSAKGSCSFTVDANVTKVVIRISKYNGSGDGSTVTINGKSYTISTTYSEIEIEQPTAGQQWTISVSANVNKNRFYISSIEYVGIPK